MTGERAHMRAVRLCGPDDVRLETLPIPTPGAGEVRVRVEAALTGGTVRKLVRRGHHATLGTPPLTLGHEGAGVISAIGPGVEGWAVGDRVVPANSAPGPDGTPQTWAVGAFANEWLVPAPIVAQNLHRMPDGLAPGTAALCDSLACVLKGLDATPVAAGEHAVVLGMGALGLLWIQLLHRAGAHVTALSRTSDRANQAVALGATTIRTADEHVAALDAGHPPADLVVEAVGTTDAWDLALRCVAPRGRINFFGGPPKGTTVAVDTQRLHYDELTLTASFHHTPKHFAAALATLARGEVDVSTILGERITLDEVPAFVTSDVPRARPKAIVVPR